MMLSKAMYAALGAARDYEDRADPLAVDPMAGIANPATVAALRSRGLLDAAGVTGAGRAALREHEDAVRRQAREEYKAWQHEAWATFCAEEERLEAARSKVRLTSKGQADA